MQHFPFRELRIVTRSVFYVTGEFQRNSLLHKKIAISYVKEIAILSTWARGFEPPTFWSVAKRSIQLSYAHISVISRSQQNI